MNATRKTVKAEVGKSYTFINRKGGEVMSGLCLKVSGFGRYVTMGVGSQTHYIFRHMVIAETSMRISL